jgi:hypothetical protein
MKGAHADLSSAAWQEIGVEPFFGLSGIMALDVQLLVCHNRQKKILQKSTLFSDSGGTGFVSGVLKQTPFYLPKQESKHQR